MVQKLGRKRQFDRAAAAALRKPCARGVDDHVAHYLRGEREKRAPVFRTQLRRLNEPDIRLVHQRRCIEHLVAAALIQAHMREFLQFPIS